MTGHPIELTAGGSDPNAPVSQAPRWWPSRSPRTPGRRRWRTTSACWWPGRWTGCPASSPGLPSRSCCPRSHTWETHATEPEPEPERPVKLKRNKRVRRRTTAEILRSSNEPTHWKLTGSVENSVLNSTCWLTLVWPDTGQSDPMVGSDRLAKLVLYMQSHKLTQLVLI